MRVEHDFDFDEDNMSEMVPTFSVPVLLPPLGISRSSSSRVMLDLDQLMEEERLREERRLCQLKERQQHIGEQVGRCLAQKERKIRQLQDQQKIKMYEQCTFHPKTISKGEKRSFNQFLALQDQFTKKIAAKRNTLKNALDSAKEENTYHPKINNKNKSTEPKPNKETVFQRLYALKDKQNNDGGLNQNQQDFQPKITQKSKKLNRQAPIDQLLYKDALRRQEKAKDIETYQSAPQKIPQKLVNLSNEKYVAQKFIKEYFAVIQRLGVATSTQNQIEYVVFNEILKQMSFVGVEEEGESSHERTLVHQAYQLLEKYCVNAKNVCVFLLAIIGIYHINPVNFQGEEEDSEQGFLLSEPEGRRLQKYYDHFKRNRLSCQAAKKDDQKWGRDQPEHSFHPKINKVSQELAEKYREQMLDEANRLLADYPELDHNIPQDGIITHTDLLVLSKLAKEIKLQQKKDIESKRVIDACTFKPTTLPSSMQNSKVSNAQGLGQKKSIQLYNYHRSLINKKESLKTSRQNEHQDLKECTFAPNLYQTQTKVHDDPKGYYSKQVEETLYRMKKGRKQQDEKNKFLQRGQKSIKKDKEYSSIKEKITKRQKTEETPTLLLDVNLGDKVDRITLFPGDQGRLEEVAREFAGKHGLDAENEIKLCQLLRIELESVLMKIDQGQQAEDEVTQ